LRNLIFFSKLLGSAFDCEKSFNFLLLSLSLLKNLQELSILDLSVISDIHEPEELLQVFILKINTQLGEE
jgi:hypothetical protein